jgi:hypothetical protein
MNSEILNKRPISVIIGFILMILTVAIPIFAFFEPATKNPKLLFALSLVFIQVFAIYMVFGRSIWMVTLISIILLACLVFLRIRWPRWLFTILALASRLPIAFFAQVEALMISSFFVTLGSLILLFVPKSRRWLRTA